MKDFNRKSSVSLNKDKQVGASKSSVIVSSGLNVVVIHWTVFIACE